MDSRFRTWHSYGVKIVIDTSNIGTKEGCEKLVLGSMSHGKIGGVFNLAVVLRDGIFDNQTKETFDESFMPKAYATLFLDKLTRIYCPSLRYFVIFSSASCGRGNAGQSNYGMANAVMERIVEKRADDGLPAKAIQWGAIGEVGLVAEMAKDRLDFEIAGTIQQRIASCLRLMDHLMMSEDPVVSSMVVAQKQVSSKLNMIDSVLNIMGIRDLKSVSKNATLAELGMDSLMAVEIKQALEREFEILLSAQDLRTLTFARLQELSDSSKSKDASNANASNKEDDEMNMQRVFKTLGDEATSGENMMELNELCKSAVNFDACTIVIPGNEGVLTEKAIEMGKNIGTPCYGMQFFSAVDETTMEGLVAFVYSVSSIDFSPANRFRHGSLLSSRTLSDYYPSISNSTSSATRSGRR